MCTLCRVDGVRNDALGSRGLCRFCHSVLGIQWWREFDDILLAVFNLLSVMSNIIIIYREWKN